MTVAVDVCSRGNVEDVDARRLLSAVFNVVDTPDVIFFQKFRAGKMAEKLEKKKIRLKIRYGFYIILAVYHPHSNSAKCGDNDNG